MNDKRKVLYEQLSKDYDLGDFDSFSAKLDDENKRKALYDAVSEEYELGDYDSFVNKIAPAKTYQPTEEEVQQRILTNKPDMFKPKTVDMYGAHDKDKSAFDLMQEGRSYDMLEANQRYNQRPITESGEAFKQGADALYQGGKNLVGETANVLTGSQRDYSRAKMQLNELVRSGYDMTNFDVEKALSDYKDREFQRRMGEWQKEIESRKGERKDMNFFDALLHRIQDPSRPKSQYEDAGMFADELQLRRSYHAIQDALQKSNGNVEEAYKLLSSNEGKETWGDKVTREAREELAKQRPTEGTAAWIGGMIPQMIGTGAGVAMSFTPWGRIARFLGQANMMALTGSTAGMSMAEARDYAERKGQPANEGDVWRSGMIDAAIEYGTERIPFNRYFNNVQDASSSFIGQFFSNAVKGNGNAKNELSSLLNKAAKDFKLDYISKDKIEEYLTDVVVEGVSELSAEVLQTLSPMIYQNPEDYPTLKEILDNGLEGAKGGLFMGAFIGGGSSFANTYRNRKRREKQGGVRLANTSKNGVVELLGEDEEGIHAVTPKGEEVILSKEDIVEERNYTLEEFENAAREKVMSDVRDNIEADNQFIDSVTDPSTGMYTEVDRLVVENGEMVRQHGYIVGWIDDAPVFLAEGLENTQENRVILKPNQWDKESMQQLPNDRVKAINEEMVREEAAVRMGEESKYAPEVLKSQMQQGVPFDTPTSRIVPISPMPEGNGWVVEEYAMDTENKVSKMPIAREMTTEEYRDIMQAQYEAQQAESAPSESVGEQVNTPVNTEVNNPMKNTESTPMSPMSEEVQSATEEKSTQPVIPTKKDGSIDFVAYGKENSLKDLGNQYGEKLPNKVAITAKAYADDLIAAQAKLDKAQEAVDNAPIGREAKQKKALEEAENAYNEAKREADFWAEMDADIKNAQAAREAMLNPKVEVDMSDSPQTVDEFVAQQLASGNIVLTSESFKKETGYGEKERKKFPKLFRKAENGGLTIEQAGERLMEMDRENGTNFFDQEDANAGRDAIINMLGSVRSWGDITGYIRNNREQQANRDAEGLRNEIEEAIESNYHMTPEDYATLQEMESVENPFGALDVATKDAIFVEAYEEYEQSLNPKQNDEGRTSEIAEGNSDVLSEERTDNEGGTSERQGERPDVSEGTVQQNDAAQETEQVEEPLSIQEGESPVAFAERVLEEQRRKPLRKRIKEWAASGVKVNVIERLEDVPNKDALAAIEDGSIVPGWYESSSNEVYVYLPHVADLKDLDVTIIHEGLSHKGVRELLGEERFGELCDKVWDMMSRPDKDFYISYPGVNGNTRAAADEYIAHLAEKVNLTPEEQTIWDKIVKLFRDALDRALNGILTKSQITDADIAELIKMSYANLKSGAEDGVSGDGTRFRFSKTPQEFDAVQKEAVEKKGIVMPGLNEADVDVLSIHKHDFNGNLKQAREEAKQWAIENYQGKEFTLPEDGGLYTIGKKAINKYVDKTSIEKSDDAMIHLSALKELPNIISSSITGEIHADYKKGENGQRSIDNGIGDKGLLVHRMYGAIELDGKTYRVKTTMNEYRDPLASNTPHSYEVTEIELIESSSTPSLKDDSKPLNVSNNSITSANLLNGVEKSYDKGKKLLDESEKTRFRVVYHGSAADFDKFDHSKMGSGAGSQVFGWGTYLTESEKVGRDYGDVALQSENRFTYVGDKDVNKWTVADAEQIMHTAGSYEEAIKRYGNATLAPGTALEQAVTFLKSTKKEDWQGKRHLYEVEIPSEKHGNYIVYGNNVTDAAAKKVFDGIYKRLSQTEEYDNPTAKKELKRELDDLKSGYGQGQPGIWKDLYGDISSYLGSDKEASLFLRSLGYVGIKYPAGSIYQGDYGGASNYVIFDENDLKIVNHTRFRIANRNQEVFVSNAQRAVEGIKQEKGTPQQWLAMIEKNGGLKAGEDKWLGLSDWLKGLDKKSVTKDEILEFIGENKIAIEEVHYGGKDMSAEDIKKTFDYKALVDDLTEYDNDGNPYISEEKYNYLVKETVDFKIGFKLVDGKLEIKNPFAASMYLGIAPKTIEGVRINYTTEGLENKAEIALTVPTIEPWNESDEIHFGDAGEGRAIAWIRFGETSTPNVAFINAREAVNNYIAEMREKYNVRGGGIYDVMNEDEVKHLQELTSAEFDTRDKVERVLVIDEIQSKRHQEGREKGYKSKEVDYLRKELEGLHEKLYSDGLTAEEYQRNREIQQRLREIGNNGTIPEAPFEKNWSELAMKRMLRYAAENGYDKVAWTTGAQQAERYNLSKFVDNIRCNRVGKNGNKSFVLEGIDYNVVANNEGLVVAGADEFKGKHLSEIVGSSLSDKMLGMEEGDVLNDTDLHIGGEGMKGFYDKMLPSFVNKYVKKWGTKVQDIELPNVEEAGRIMYSVDVTDAMKESVMQGQTMFRVASEPAIDYVSQANDVVEVPRNEVFYTMNDIAIKLYMISGNYMRQLYKYGTLGRVLKGDYAEIDQIKAKNEYDHAKPIFDKYLNELVWMKSHSTEAAQEVINGVISDVEYAMQYYKDLALGKDVWRTDEKPRFRIVEKQREDAQKQVDDFTSKYNSKPVTVVDSSMSDEELSEAFDGKIDVNELRDFMNKSKSMGGFVRDLNKVVIFADKMKQGRMEESLFHENIHALINEGNYTKLLAQFYEYAKDDETFSRWKTISENAEYKPYERAEEFFAYVVSNGMVADNLEDVLKYLDNERQAELNELLNKIGYNYDNRRRSIEESVDGRRAERVSEESVVSGDALQVSGASGKTGRGNGESEKGSPREKAEELRKLFERVASEGLRGVVGDAAYDMAMIDVYHALPEKERVEVSMNAVRNLGGNVAAAVDEYLEGKDKASLWDKVTGIIRDVLRKAGFDLDLTGNDVKYLLWRSKKPLDKDNLLDLAEDIDMRYRLKVGEYEGSPTENEDVYEGDDNAGVRFRVVTDASLIEELESSEKRIGYRNVVLNEDGSFGSPMADKLGKTGGGKKKTSGFEIGKWEQAEENPDLVDENGKIDLIKPDGKQIKKVDYNPYIHNRLNCVNRQFKQAWERPDLAYVETEIPMFDLESGYHADKAKKPVGEHKWNGGNLILSRYDKPVRIVGWEEVADDWEKAFKKKGVHFDIVPPALLPILVERGVKILPPHKGMGEDCNKAYQKFANNTPDGGGTRFRTSEDVLNQIKQARKEVEKNPSEAQKEAGNYKKGHISLDGFEITLENPKGGTRSGVDKNGKKWNITMNNDYGYIRGTEAVDGDHIDVFLSDNPTEGRVFVVDQLNEEGFFDESKVMYGFDTLNEARDAYLSNYKKGWEKRIMAITEVSKEEFKKWIDSSHRKTKAFSEYKSINSNNDDIRFRTVYHGSSASFDKFDHSFMGTGEGNQAYGWGSYVTEVDGIARSYAQNGVLYNPREDIKYIGDFGEYVGERIIDIARSYLIDGRYNLEKAKEYARNDMKHFMPETSRKGCEFLLGTSEDDWVFNYRHHLYEVDIPDDNGHNYLPWSDMLTDEQLEGVRNAMRNSDIFNAYAKKYGRELANERLDNWTNVSEFKYAYNHLQNFVDVDKGADKIISQILSNAGFVGIKYPAEYMSGGRADNAKNYVIFNEDDLQIVEHTRFRTKKKEKIDLADNRDAIIKKYDEELKSHSFNFQEAFQDRMLSVKVLMDLIEQETGKKARSFEDAYKAENQLGSINKPAQEKWLETFYKPLLEEMHKLTEKYGRKEVENYIYCKSGLERNEVLRQRDADEAYEEAKEELDSKLAKKEIDQAQYNTLLQMAEDQRKKTLSEDVDYSGIRGLLMNTRADELFEQYQKGTITESEYKQKVADLKKNEEQVIKDWKKFAENQVSYLENKASKNELNALWDKINAATNETLRIDFESGMIDRETYEAEKKMMKYYVPLRNWENTTAEEMYEYRHDMTPAVSSNQKRAKGRKTQADNPIATIALMAQNAIVRGNRNKMKINLYSFVVNRPTALASVRNVWYVKNANNKWEPQYADTSAASNQDEINQIMEQFELDMQQLAEQGKAFKGKIKQGMHFQASRKQKDEHVVTVMINGKEYGIYINGNPRAAQAINGMTNAEGVDDAGKWIDALKRYYGAGLTSWNPDFIIPNMVRDTIHATTMTFLDKGVIESAKYAWNVPKMFTQITKEVTGISTGDPKLHKYFEEFVKNGGETGYTAIHTLEDYKKEYERLVNEAKGVKSSIAKGGKNLIKELSKILEAANRIAEDVNRFNAYVTSRKSGENIKNSIDAAKNITVNFNRKGALSANNTVYGKVASLMSRWILFFNPSVQGIHQLVTKSKANPKRAMSMGATILSSGFLVPMINEMLVAAFGGDDEDDYWNQSDYKRRNNLMLFAGDGYVSIPLPPVLRELYGMGDIMYGVITGHIPAQRAIYDTLKQIQSAVGFVNLLPEVSQEPDMITYAKGFAPDLAAPLLDVISNTNFMGRPIAKWTDYNEYDPEYMRVYKGVSPQWIELSKLLNEVGGNETRRSDKLGNFINPAMMEHLFTSYTGGIGKTINNLAGMIVDAATGNTENMDIFRKTPIIPRFYTPNDEKTVQPAINRKYYEFEYQYNNATKSLKKAKDGVKNGEHPEWQKYIDEMEKNGEQEFIKYFKKEQKRLKKLQDKLKEEPNNKEYEKKVYDKKAEISLESFKILSGQDK